MSSIGAIGGNLGRDTGEPKVMRGMDTDESAKLLLEGQRIHYNYLRPHMGLDGKTPAEKAGIDLKLEGNKWEQLIKKAKRSQKKTKNEADST